MKDEIEKLDAQMQHMTAKELKSRYAEVYGETSNSSNKQWLIKRLACGTQMKKEGDISQRAREKALAIAKTSDIRTTIPNNINVSQRKVTKSVDFKIDSRLPMPGSVLTKRHKGRLYETTVLNDGFLYMGQKFRSLSAVAKSISGTHCNGYLFFGLTKEN